MATDKEKADAYRLVAEEDYHHAVSASTGRGSFTSACRQIADELDPKPTWPDGTIAWVTNQAHDTYLCQWIETEGSWCIGGPDGDSMVARISKVEPLRILADDEIAVPRHFKTALQFCYAEHPNCALSRTLLRDHIDALEAEEAQVRP